VTKLKAPDSSDPLINQSGLSPSGNFCFLKETPSWTSPFPKCQNSPGPSCSVLLLNSPSQVTPRQGREGGPLSPEPKISWGAGGRTVPKWAKEEGLGSTERDPFVFQPDFHKMQILNKLFIVWGQGKLGAGEGGRRGHCVGEKPPVPTP
jgi:hypothetical protein